MTPIQRPQSSSDVLRSNYYANVQAGVPQGMQHAAQIGYAPPMPSPMHSNVFQASPVHPDMQSFHSSQMQTPPPTRGTSAKKAQQPTQIAFGTPSTIVSRRFMTPQQPVMNHNVPLAHQTPMHFPQLQFSPDLYQFANLGPASAPVMPQTQLLWAQTQSPVGVAQHSPLEDPFAPGMSDGGTWAQPSPQTSNGQSAMFETPAMVSFPVQAPHPRPSSAVQLGSHTPAQMLPAASSASLDPSLIYSSPMRPVVRSSDRAGKPKPESIARSNNRSSKARLEPKDPDTKRKDSTASSQTRDSISPLGAAPAFTGPGLRRSNTTGATVPKGVHPFTSSAEDLSRSNSVTQVPRTASPLKRAGRTPLGSISEYKPRQQASVILTVDENGNARTETRRVDDSPTKSIRDRYPGLFDSDSSDDESDTSEQPPSRSASFTFGKGEERRPKAARLDPPVENLEGIDLPRSSSRGSIKSVAPSRAAIAAAATLRRQGSLRRTNRTTPAKRNAMTRSASSLIDACPMDVSSETLHSSGSIQHQTAASYDDRDSWSGAMSGHDGLRGGQQTMVETALDAHNRHWSMMSFEQQHISPQHQQAYAANFRPVQQPPLRKAPLIRCICGVSHDQGQLMVQCSSCTQWLHSGCVGLNGSQMPAQYTCFLCTKPTRR